MKKSVTWIVVADHQHLRILANDAPGHELRPVEGLELETGLASGRNIACDRPGRACESVDGARDEPRCEEGGRFIGRITEILADASAHGDFDRLVLVVPPRALDEFRNRLAPELRDKILVELTEDLTSVPTERLRDRLALYVRL